MAEKTPSGDKPKKPKTDPKKGKDWDKFNKGLDKIFGPKKGDGSNRA